MFLEDCGFEVVVVQQGGTFSVSGKDAASLHARLTAASPKERILEIGPLADGCFTLRKCEESSALRATG
jgi:hypothetical protein